MWLTAFGSWSSGMFVRTWRVSGGPGERPGAEGQGNLLDVLGCGCKQALDAHPHQAAAACGAVAGQLLGFGEGTFYRLLATAADALAPCGQGVGIERLLGRGANVTDNGALRLGV